MASAPAPETGDLLARIAPVHGALQRLYVIPQWRVVFNSLNKNACTSLKWMIADLAGEDLESFTPRLKPFTGDEEAIHDRSLWKASPMLSEMDPQARAHIDPDNGWFVFAVVRDPRIRIFSAWQNKLLIENPAVRPRRNEAWYPRHPADAQTIREDFARFIDLFERHPDHGLRRDPHFRGQAELLMPSALSYTRVYDISEIDELCVDLKRHLRTLGWSGALHLPRSNSMPLAVNASLLAGGLRERIERLYAADFKMFPDRWDYSQIASAEEWSDEALAQVELLAGFGRRIGDLRATALCYEAKVREAAAKRWRARCRRLLGRLRRRLTRAPLDNA